jgi:hypothetical protein
MSASGLVIPSETLIGEQPVWIDQLSRSAIFHVRQFFSLNADCNHPPHDQDVGFPVHLNTDPSFQPDAHSQVLNMLTFAYENRDLQIGQIFTLERLHRRTLMALEMQKVALVDLRSRRAAQHAELENIKNVLSDAGYKAEVERFANREAPSGSSLQPCNLAFVYKAPGMSLDDASFPAY